MNAISQTYEDVEKYVYHVCHGFRRQYGGDIEELIAQANLLYVRAFYSHDPRKGPFIPWLKLKIWGGLMDRYRNQRYRENILNRVDLDMENTPSASLSSLLTPDHLSEDARALIGMICDSPRELRDLMRIPQNPRDVSDELVQLARRIYKRNGLWDYLLGEGWKRERIQKTFREIEENL